MTALLLAAALTGASLQAPAAVAGRVADARTGAPLRGALVRLQGQDAARDATADADGRFAIERLPSGRWTLTVSATGYALAMREIVLAPGERQTLELRMVEGAPPYVEELTVRGTLAPERGVPAQQTLARGDMEDLRGVLADDPLRAVQALPGVVAGDDLRSEFSVRGQDFRHIGIALDGVFSPALLHSVRGLEDTGSIAMINSDVLESAALLVGAYPQRFGGRTGAQLDFTTRDGSRDRRRARIVVSGTNSAAVADGPIAGGRGAWLGAVRQSYLDLLLRKLSPDSPVDFGFTDGQAKLSWDASARHRLGLAVVAGRSRFERPDEDRRNQLHDGTNETALANLSWRAAPSPRVLIVQRVYWVGNRYTAFDHRGVRLDVGSTRDVTYRADLTAAWGEAAGLDVGGHVQRLRGTRRQDRADSRLRLTTLERYDVGASAASAYAQVRAAPSAAVWLAAGARVDRRTLTGDLDVSPWGRADVALGSSVRLTAAAGLARQYADFDQIVGHRGRQDLRPERSYHADVGLGQTLGALRWQLTLYNREDRDYLRLPYDEPRIAMGWLFPGSVASRYVNALDGYSRGVELLLQRRSATGLSGWMSYALGFTRYRDRVLGETFWGDFDQRHTINAHARYRFSGRTSLAANFRAGSNVPVTGYVERRGGEFFVGERRNVARMPVYSRLDVRVNRTFTWRRGRLTLFGEVLNVYGRDNPRLVEGRVDAATGRYRSFMAGSFPIVPSAGILVEF
jgi:hypothetical protein